MKRLEVVATLACHTRHKDFGLRCFVHSVLAAAAICITGQHANAGLLGSSVNGQLNFGGNPTNFFDPANGFVPPSFLNAAGPTVTIAEPAIEFGYMDGANLDTANFTDTQLFISDTVTSSGSNSALTMTFTDPAFTSVSEVGDNFPGGLSASLVGDVLTVTWGGGSVTAGQAFTGAFNIGSATVTPEPTSLTLLGMGAVGLLGYGWRRKRTA
jgi:hypothetical protein